MREKGRGTPSRDLEPDSTTIVPEEKRNQKGMKSRKKKRGYNIVNGIAKIKGQ